MNLKDLDHLPTCTECGAVFETQEQLDTLKYARTTADSDHYNCSVCGKEGIDIFSKDEEIEEYEIEKKELVFPGHYMTSMAISGQKEECAVMVYGKDGNKCHTIYGDLLYSDLREPTDKELNFIHNASNLMALTNREKEKLEIYYNSLKK